MARQGSRVSKGSRKTLPTRNGRSYRELEAIAHTVIRTTIDQNIEEVAKAGLREAIESATLQAVNGQQALANESGAMILDALAQLRTEVADLRTEVADLRDQVAKLQADNADLGDQVAKLQADNADLGDQVAKLQAFTESFLDVRERSFDTWLRDYWRDNSNARRRNIRRLNQNVVHGGNAYADAQMVMGRRQGDNSEYQKFVSLYGLTPEVVIDLALSDRRSILRVLDFVGNIHLSRRRLREDEESILRSIVNSIEASGNYDEADGFSQQFPF